MTAHDTNSHFALPGDTVAPVCSDAFRFGIERAYDLTPTESRNYDLGLWLGEDDDR